MTDMRGIERAVGVLRQKLQSARDLEEVLEAFMDLTELPGIHELGTPSRHELVERAMSLILSYAWPGSKDDGVGGMKVTHCPSLGLIHGVVLRPGGYGVFFYVPDLDRGAAWLLGDGRGAGYYRFSVLEVTQPAYPAPAAEA